MILKKKPNKPNKC